MPKLEGKNRSPNDETSIDSALGILASSFFRHSSFVLRRFTDVC